MFRSADKVVRGAVSSALLLSLVTPTLSFGQSDQSAKAAREAYVSVAQKANEPWAHYFRNLNNQVQGWRRSSGRPSHLHIRQTPIARHQFSDEQLQTFIRTQRRLDQVEPSPLGFFAESANTAVKVNGQWHIWDSLGIVGLTNPDNINRLLDQTLETGHTDIRIGLDLGKIDLGKPESLDYFFELYVIPMWERGMLPYISLDWFSNAEGEKRTNKDGSTNRLFSFVNNPDFIANRTKLAEMFAKRLKSEMTEFNARRGNVRPARAGINILNEPHTRVAFSEQFWEESLENGVNWSHPELQRYHIPAMINVGRAVNSMRYVIEKNLGNELYFFATNEAMTMGNYPTHDRYFRFAILRLIMGDRVFVDADYDALMTEPLDQLEQRLKNTEVAKNTKGETLNELEGMLKLFIFSSWNDTPKKKEDARRMLVTMLQRYKRDVSRLKNELGITMAENNVFLGDYYAQSEFVLPKPVPELAKDLARYNGRLLKEVLDFRNNDAFFEELRNFAQRAEAKSGGKIWKGWSILSEMKSQDFLDLLTAEDAVMMDLLIGFRYANWEATGGPELAARRKRAGLDEELSVFLNSKDEFRSDEFLNSILANNAKKLRRSLNVKTDAELLQVLKSAADDQSDNGPKVRIASEDTLRDILNKNSRRVLMRLFGLRNERWLGFLPQHVPIQIRFGIRLGVGAMLLEYAKAAGVLHIGIGESGSPWIFANETVQEQTALSIAQDAVEAGYVLTTMHYGSWTDTIGWSPSPLAGDLTTNGEVNRSGVFSWEKDGERFTYSLAAWPGKAPWMTTFSEPLLRAHEEVRSRRAAESANLSAGVKAKPFTAQVVSPRRSTVRTCEGTFGAKLAR